MKKQKWYLLYVLVVSIIILEFSPYIVTPILLKRTFLKEQFKKELEAQYGMRMESNQGIENDSLQNNNNPNFLSKFVLHPYYGYSHPPDSFRNRFGFLGNDPILTKSSDKVNICLMGGSVAKWVYDQSKETIITNLKQSRAFHDKDINIVSIALGGFKQPQQLLALTYLLSLGAQYDIVINLDGFNEIVLPYSDNLQQNVFPSYPRSWNLFSRKSLDIESQLLMAEQFQVREEQSNLCKYFHESPLRKSNFGLFIWKILNNKREVTKYQLEEKLIKSISLSESDYQSTGPQIIFQDTLSFFTEQADLWERTSKLISDLGKSSDFVYLHFLQPNQYYAGSKNLTDDELENAYQHKPFRYKTGVQIGYPILVAKGRQLTKQGVNFTDLTMMFKNENRTLYTDKCCHFNTLGNNLIGEEIAKNIIDHFD